MKESDLTKEEWDDLSNQIADIMTMFINQGMTSMSDLDICHQCGKMKLYCKCLDCNCINCKKRE